MCIIYQSDREFSFPLINLIYVTVYVAVFCQFCWLSHSRLRVLPLRQRDGLTVMIDLISTRSTALKADECCPLKSLAGSFIGEFISFNLAKDNQS